MDEFGRAQFNGHEPLAGAEHLGRHIRDRFGAPSGSPANFEALRGQESEPRLREETITQMVRDLLAQLPPTADGQ